MSRKADPRREEIRAERQKATRDYRVVIAELDDRDATLNVEIAEEKYKAALAAAAAE